MNPTTLTLQEQIDNEINNLVPQMISDGVTSHTHNGSDSQQIQGQYLSQAPQSALTLPTGGSTIDTQARQAISDLYAKLQSLGLIS